MRTITAMFDSRADAETARGRLAAAGISADNVSIHDKSSLAHPADDRGSAYAGDHGTASSEADGRDGTHRNAIGDYIDNRTGDRLMEDAGSERTALGDYVEGENNSHAHHENASHDHDGPGLWSKIKAFFTGDDDVYEEAMRRGGYLVTARVDDHDAERAIDILDADGTVDLEARETSWRSEGWMGGPNTVTTDRGSRPRVGSYISDDYRE
ncbi:hypothetical protein [Polymorphobacter fuscus]|uniref:General stress protein 17M-like domain-containing protein n=1 Tax=Sandarakinorhabdus fusca TaxID=1439888 RepID=A0A7C9KK07_9SPHN|nr:hypothetical protein [Polymorphobacter fuscus]KAB7648630.1 hypothetical protein F9290_02775 [Polymorphobacter fuscus]MQT16183.1 hypothetical protein [Polymorphobacter fuscus]NJC07534.1 hypothetical protein [Polymorphobacter fuscus]